MQLKKKMPPAPRINPYFLRPLKVRRYKQNKYRVGKNPLRKNTDFFTARPSSDVGEYDPDSSLQYQFQDQLRPWYKKARDTAVAVGSYAPFILPALGAAVGTLPFAAHAGVKRIGQKVGQVFGKEPVDKSYLETFLNTGLLNWREAIKGITDKRIGPADLTRRDEIMDALKFANNAYTYPQQVKGWQYYWYKVERAEKAFMATRINPKTNKRDVVFSFRGTNAATSSDVLTDLHAFSPRTITNWGDFKLPFPLSGHRGFINRIDLLGKDSSMCKDVETLLESYFEALENEHIDEQEPEPMELTNADLDVLLGEDYSDDEPMFDYDEHHRLLDKEGNLVGGVKPNVDSLDSPALIGDILVTGHSLGGAVAEIFAAILTEILPPELVVLVRLVTFEGARGLTSKTVDELEQNPIAANVLHNSIRIINLNDPVPFAPFNKSSLPFASGYKHFGETWVIAPEYTVGGFAASHTLGNVEESLKQAFDSGKPDAIYVSAGKGKIQSTKRRRNATAVPDPEGYGWRKLRKNSRAMKAKMAYVRSFRKH